MNWFLLALGSMVTGSSSCCDESSSLDSDKRRRGFRPGVLLTVDPRKTADVSSDDETELD